MLLKGNISCVHHTPHHNHFPTPPLFAIHDATPITTAPVTIQNTALAILSNHERGLSTSLVSVLTTS